MRVNINDMYQSDIQSMHKSVLDTLKSGDYHTVDDIAAWFDKHKTNILKMYGGNKNIDFTDVFTANMSNILQSIVDSALPIEFSMEKLSMYMEQTFSLDSPLWHVPDSFLM